MVWFNSPEGLTNLSYHIRHMKDLIGFLFDLYPIEGFSGNFWFGLDGRKENGKTKGER